MTTSPTTEPAISPPVGERTVRRIAYLIPSFGFTAGLVAVLFYRLDWAEGLLAGSALAWLNFRWLKGGVKAITSGPAAAQANGESAKRHTATYLSVIFRYFLIGAAVYVIFNFLHVPLVSIALGLCSFVAATIVASVWEILQSVK